jgi:hypothetical protein
MLDYLHIPKQQKGNIDYFRGISNTDGGSWIAWEKPSHIQMIRITCISGGGGGGSGFTAASTTARAGGGGGGSSAISIVTIPAYVLPDILYVSSGIGGTGGARINVGANVGTNGINSYVCIAQNTGVIYRVCYADSGKAGTAATSTAGGGSGAGGTIATTADMLLASYGISNFIGGQAGSTGSLTGANGINYPTTGLLLSGGSGGSGGTSANGNGISAPTQTVYNIFPSINDNGGTGIEIYQPLLSTGGSCGYAATAGGTDGGTGGFGSGGGGGGAGGTGGTFGGAGGKGGNGLVIIHSW